MLIYPGPFHRRTVCWNWNHRPPSFNVIHGRKKGITPSEINKYEMKYQFLYDLVRHGRESHFTILRHRHIFFHIYVYFNVKRVCLAHCWLNHTYFIDGSGNLQCHSIWFYSFGLSVAAPILYYRWIQYIRTLCSVRNSHTMRKKK